MLTPLLAGLWVLACARPDLPAPPTAPQALEMQDIPPIPADLRARMAPYLAVRSARLQDLAPDGREMLISTRFADTAQIHRVRAPLGARAQLTFREEPSRFARYVPGSGAIVFLSDAGGDEEYQIYRLDPSSPLPARLTDGVSRHNALLWDRAGARLAYTSNARNGRDMDLYLSGPGGSVDPAAPPRRALTGSWSPLAFSPDDRQLLLEEYRAIDDSSLHLLDLQTDELRPLSPPGRAGYRDAAFAPDGRTLYVVTDRDREFATLFALDLAGDASEGAAWTPLTADVPWNVEQLDVSPDGRTLVFAINEHGLSRLRRLDLASGALSPIGGVPPGVVSDLRFAEAAPVFGFTLESATYEGDVYTYDLAAGALTRWTESEMGGLDPARLIEPTLVTYPTFDGREIPAFYYRPPGPGPFPVVIRIHGGPEVQARPAFAAQPQFLAAEEGIATLVPNVRGSNGYGRTYLSLDDGRLREDSVRDIGALLDWIAEQPDLDASRVAVTGGSYGGYMVLASLIHFGERIRAGVDVVGISSFVTFLENTSAYRRDLRRAEYGDESDPQMRAFLEQISPLARASEIRSALLVAHGANDPRVPVGEARQIADAVRANGRPVWMMVAPDEGHGFGKKSNADTFSLVSTMFLLEQLKPAP